MQDNDGIFDLSHGGKVARHLAIDALLMVYRRHVNADERTVSFIFIKCVHFFFPSFLKRPIQATVFQSIDLIGKKAAEFKIVRNEQVAQTLLPLDTLEQPDHLRL